MNTLIDVRTPEEYAAGHIEGAVNVPVDGIPEGNLGELMNVEQNAPIQLYCQSGSRADYAKSLLEVIGYTNVTSLGGMEEAKVTLG